MSDYVEVTGSGAASGVPDVVVLDTRIQCDGPDVATALSACTERTNLVVAATSAAGVADRDRQTTGVGVNQRWDHQGQAVVGFTAYQSLRVLVRDRTDVGDLIAALAAAAGDAFALDSVTLRVADTAPLLAQAREAAFADARAKAELYAGLAGRALASPTRVRETVGDGGGPQPVFRLAAAKDSAGGMPVEAGESTVTASVCVRWAMVDR